MKLIALDMDGTILTSKKEITPETVRAIKRVQEQGHIVMVMSGRPSESIIPVLQKYELDCPIGASNGNMVLLNGEVLEMTSLNPSQNKRIIEEMEKEYLLYELYSNLGIHIPSDWENRMERALKSGEVPTEYFEDDHFKSSLNIAYVEKDMLFFDDIDSLLKNRDLSLQKIYVLAYVPEQKQRLLCSLASIEDLYIIDTTPFNIEITKGNKGDGLIVMAEHFQIPLKDTIVIGDQRNDIPMFQVAGISIAMGNAVEEVKNMSDFATLTNDENGVAYAIENYVLKD
jgi:Cof subfamily protein (haloacid dehalogenase superfamily)